LGLDAGNGATNANNSNFLGWNAGENATNAEFSNFLGNNAGKDATNAAYSNFLGRDAGRGATNAKDSIFLGSYAGFNDTVNNTANSGTSIAIGRYSGTGGFSNSIALGRGVTNSAAQQLNIGNVLYATGMYNSDTQSASPTGGNVGIGTVTPGSTLDVKGTFRLSGATSGFVGFAPAAAAGSTTYTWPSADGTTGQVLSTNASGVLSWAAAGGSSQWTTNGSKIYYNTGNVGIGTNDPVDRLQVGDGTADFRLSVMSNTTKQFTAKNAIGNSVKYGASTDSLPNAVISNNDDTALMTILYGGNVGIGTTTPSAKLSVTGSGAGTGLAFLIANSSNVNRFQVQDNGNAALAGSFAIGSTSGLQWGNNGSAGSITGFLQYLSNGVLLMSDSGANNFGRLILGGNTSAYPSIKRNGAGIDIRLGDDSGFAGITALTGSFTGSGNSYFAGNVGIGTTTPLSLLHVANVSTNSGGGIVVDTGITAKGTFQTLNVSGDLISFFGSNAYVDTTLTTQRYDTSKVAWSFVLDNRASQDLFKLERTPAAGGNTRPMIVLGDGSFGFGNLTSTPSFTGARFMMNSSGNVGIGTTTPADLLQVFGDVRLGTTGTNGCIKNFAGTGITGTCSSDERLKTNVVNLSDDYLDRMNKLNVITYNWNESANTLNKVDTSVTNYGLLAQNVEQFFPELVTVDSNGYKQVDYSRLPLYLLKSFQELTKKVTGFAEQFTTKKLCVGTTCVTEEEFKAMVLMAGQTPSSSNTEPSAQIDEETTLPPPITPEETGPDENTYTTDTVDTVSDASSESSIVTSTPSPASAEE